MKLDKSRPVIRPGSSGSERGISSGLMAGRLYFYGGPPGPRRNSCAFNTHWKSTGLPND